jgi:hypothetical protein
MDNIIHKINNLELRTCDSHLLSFDKHSTMEIREQLSDDRYITIAYWEKGKESFYLKHVGNRAISATIDPVTFMKLVKDGQEYLDEYFERKYYD